jgi:hypothetical protein
MFKPVLKPMTMIARAIACAMVGGLAVFLLDSARMLALPAHFV